MNYCELPQHPWPTLVAGGTGQPPCECHRASGSAGIRRLRASDAPVVPWREKRRGAFGPLDITLYMEVSINRGSPKLMGGQLTILLKWMIWGYLGVAPFSETPICMEDFGSSSNCSLVGWSIQSLSRWILPLYLG